VLRGFINYLDDYLDRTGITGLVQGALGILAFASLLSAVFGSTAIKAGALVIATLGLIGVLLMLTTHHRTLRAQADEHRLLLSRYCNALTREMNQMWHIHRWSETADIDHRGNAIGKITVHATVEAEALHFLRICVGSNWRQPERTKRNVQVTLAGLEIMGTGSTRWRETSRWRPDGRLEVLAHCVSTLPKRGDQIRLHFDYTWPGKCVPLVRREVDEFVWEFSRPLAQLEYQIMLPVGMRTRYETVGLDKQDTFDLSLYSPKHKRPVVHLIANDIAADRRVGLRLDLQ